MTTRVFNLMLAAAMVLAACGGAARPLAVSSPQPTTSIDTPVSPITSPLATSAARTEGGLSTQPGAAAWANAPQAALRARQALIDQLQVDGDTIGLVSAEPVEWPDACLGLQAPGVMCAQVITAGYNVVLSANGREYEFHTNESGGVVRWATR